MSLLNLPREYYRLGNRSLLKWYFSILFSFVIICTCWPFIGPHVIRYIFTQCSKIWQSTIHTINIRTALLLNILVLNFQQVHFTIWVAACENVFGHMLALKAQISLQIQSDKGLPLSAARISRYRQPFLYRHVIQNSLLWQFANKYGKHMFCEDVNLLIKYSVQEQIPFNGNVFGNKCCRYNEGSLYNKIYPWRAKAWMRPCTCAGLCESAYFEHAQRFFFPWCSPSVYMLKPCHAE